ncbi:MAG: phage tail sheath family protein [Nitrosospira sp.]|nr:phage tail sheath family protein [Nitrosospira sp.]
MSGIRYLDRWQQFEQWYESSPDGYLSYAVRGFFENGGESCAVAPVQSKSKNPDSSDMGSALAWSFEPGGVLDDIENIDLVCVPDAMSRVIQETGRDAIVKIQSAVLEHCHRMGDRFAILDGFESYEGASSADMRRVEQAVKHWQDLPPEHGALYFPWIHVDESFPAGDPHIGPHIKTPCETAHNTDSTMWFKDSLVTKPIPPCGHIAGIYSRTDATSGVHKAPANELLEGVIRLAMDLSDKEQSFLNKDGVNCLRTLPGRGIRVWGARTLSGQPDWSYVNVRRLFLTLTRWIRQNMHDLVYEINNPSLWERVRERLTDYCRSLFDQGALKGSSPVQAFYVKCDAETNTLETRDAGKVIAEVGLAPTVPTEFIVVRITQRASMLSVTGLNV